MFNRINSLIVKAQASLVVAAQGRQEGQALIEYGLIAALVGVALVAGLGALKNGLYDGAGGGVFDHIITNLT